MDSVKQAMQHFNEALRLFKQYAPSNKQLEARIYSGFGDAYIEFSAAALQRIGFTGQKLDTAIYYVQKALSVFNELGSEDGKTANYGRLGSIYLTQKRYSLALTNAIISKQIAHKGGFQAMEAERAAGIRKVQVFGPGSSNPDAASLRRTLVPQTAMQLRVSFAAVGLIKLKAIGTFIANGCCIF